MGADKSAFWLRCNPGSRGLFHAAGCTATLHLFDEGCIDCFARCRGLHCEPAKPRRGCVNEEVRRYTACAAFLTQRTGVQRRLAWFLERSVIVGSVSFGLSHVKIFRRLALPLSLR